MFSLNGYYYYIIIALQLICVIHCLRKGNEQKWIWIIVFLPLIGCLAYLYTEMFSRRDVRKVQSGLGSVINPGGKIKKLEQNLKFSDTFNNRVQLADAYLQTGKTDMAIDLYKQSLTGTFAENEYVITQLIAAYFEKEQYPEVIQLAKKIEHLPQFARSRTHLQYARALHYSGNNEQAEKEFKTMSARFSDYEARYYYALFLLNTNRPADARRVLETMTGEQSHLSPQERSANRTWFNNAKAKLKDI